LDVGSHAFRKIVFGNIAVNQTQHPRREFSVVFQDPTIAIRLKKHERGNGAGSFVALFEGVILDNAKEKRGGEAQYILLARKLPSIARARCGAFEQAGIAHAMNFTCFGDYPRIDPSDFFGSDPARFTRQGSQASWESAA